MDRFEWGHLNSFYGILFVFPLLGIFLWALWKRDKNYKSLFGLSMINQEVWQKSQGVFHRRWVIYGFIFILSLVALMRPQYDYVYEKVKRKGTDIVVALDISKSMLAEDISPNRFKRSTLEIKNMVDYLKGDRMGLVIFTSKARIQCPLTLDYSTYKLFLDDVNIASIGEGGTSLSKAIMESVSCFDEKYEKDRILIIVTDGESHDSKIEMAITKAKKAGIRIFTVGLGSKEGVPIRLPGEDKKESYLKDTKGKVVLTRLNDDILKEIAFSTGGAFVSGNTSGFSLTRLYEEKIAPIEGREMEGKKKKRYEDRFYVPLAIALLLLVFESLYKGSGKRFK